MWDRKNFVMLYCRDSKPGSQSIPGMSNKKSFKNKKKPCRSLVLRAFKVWEYINAGLALTFQAEKVIWIRILAYLVFTVWMVKGWQVTKTYCCSHECSFCWWKIKHKLLQTFLLCLSRQFFWRQGFLLIKFPLNREQQPVYYVKHRGGGDSHMKQTGMLVVSLRGVNFGF